ncbi:MAG: hypothetical protein IT373_17610 [Polyangiaceae bacterium]|nr:hypothetical protein [Polyangiaceae bacterium]
MALVGLAAALLGAAACGGGSDETAGGGASSSGGGGAGGGVDIPTGHPRVYLNAANRARLGAALDAGTTVATRFRAMVDAQMAGADYYAFAPEDAALVGVLTGEPAYCAYATALVEAEVVAEEALIAAGQVAEVAADSYLYVGDRVGSLALVFDWCHDALTAAERDRWLAYADQAVWNVWHPDEASWGGVLYPWSGWSVDNPSNNYFYSFLRATMLLGLASLGEDAAAEGWLDTFRVAKIGAELVPTFTADLVGGGSREGTGYGTAMRSLFHLYDFWEATTGERIWDLTPHTRASLAAFLHATVPTLDRIAPIGDHARDSTAALFDYHRSYVLVAQHLIGPADPLSDVAQSFLDGCSVPEMQNAFMFSDDFLYYDASHASTPLTALHPSYYAPGTGDVYFRASFASPGATWGAFKAGPYTESHAHRDQGSLLVYRSEWLAYDQNILSHSGIVQDEEAHNLVRIEDGGATVHMVEGAGPSELLGLHDTADHLYLAADLAPAYGGAASVARVEREIVFLKAEGAFVVVDRVDTAGGASAVWQLNAPMAPVAIAGGHRLDGAVDGLDVLRAVPAGATSAVVDWTVDPDMNGGFRLDVRDPGAAGAARFVFVLAPRGAVASLTPIATAADVGASVVFASGATVDATFARDALGGTLVYASGGATLFDGALVAGLDELPLFVAP